VRRRMAAINRSSRPCAGLRAYGHGLRAASMARAGGHTSQTMAGAIVMALSSSVLPSLPQFDRTGQERQQANDTAAGTRGIPNNMFRSFDRGLVLPRVIQAQHHMVQSSHRPRVARVEPEASFERGDTFLRLPREDQNCALTVCAANRFGLIVRARSASARPPS